MIGNSSDLCDELADDTDDRLVMVPADTANSDSNSFKSRASYVIVTPYGEHSHLVFPTKSSMTCSVLDTANSTYKRLSLEACDILNDLRCEKHLCDCVIRVEDGSQFAIHKVVLSGETFTTTIEHYSIRAVNFWMLTFFAFSKSD